MESEKIGEQPGSAKEDDNAQATGAPESTQALTYNGMFKGKLVFIIGVLWLP
jgi:hypothetical protein